MLCTGGGTGGGWCLPAPLPSLAITLPLCSHAVLLHDLAVLCVQCLVLCCHHSLSAAEVPGLYSLIARGAAALVVAPSWVAVVVAAAVKLLLVVVGGRQHRHMCCWRHHQLPVMTHRCQLSNCSCCLPDYPCMHQQWSLLVVIITHHRARW